MRPVRLSVLGLIAPVPGIVMLYSLWVLPLPVWAGVTMYIVVSLC